MDPAQAIEEPLLPEIAVVPKRPSGVAGLRAELEQLRRALAVRESELKVLESRLDEVELLRSQKLESLGVLAGGVAHEFNNLLTSILGHVDLARSALPPINPAGGSIENIARAARRAADLARQMLAFSGRGLFVVSPLHLSHVVAAMRPQIEAVLPEATSLRLDLEADLPLVEADDVQLREAVMSLAINAAEALPGDSGSVVMATGRLACRRRGLSPAYLTDGAGDGPWVFLDVIDNGCGMDEATVTKIFEPFFSTKFTGRGLGLAATWGIVRGHRGAIRVDSALGEGTTVRLLLPVGIDTQSRSRNR